MFNDLCDCMRIFSCSLEEAKTELKKFKDYDDKEIERCLNYRKCNIIVEYDPIEKEFRGHVSLPGSAGKELISKHPTELHEKYIKTVKKYVKSLPKKQVDFDKELKKEFEKQIKYDVRECISEGLSPEETASVTGYPIEKVNKIIEYDRKRIEDYLRKSRETIDN